MVRSSVMNMVVGRVSGLFRLELRLFRFGLDSWV